MIEFYKEFGDLGYLANYSNHGFSIDGVYYKTVEHYYQAMKYDNKEIKNRIINAETPKEASNIGRDRNNKRIDNFKDIKNDIMFNGILEKFRQNRDIAYKLIETRNNDIAEATVDEYYWGIGKDRSGQNNIGKILVQVRERIKREILDSIVNNAKREEEVYVIGHFNPDCDSVFSSYLLSNILNKLGVNAKFAFLDDYEVMVNEKKIINDFLKVKPEIIDKNHKFILVDHNNLEGLDKNNVLGAIDHHIISGEVYDTLEIEYTSTALLIYDLFKDVYEFSKEEKELIGITVLTDSEYLLSSRYREEDKKLFKELDFNLDINKLQRKYFVITDFKKSVKENMNSNYKEYNYKDKHVCRSLIYSYLDEYKKYFNEYLEYAKKNNLLLIWCDYECKKTYVYFEGKELKIDYILNSTNLILKMLED